MARSLVEQLHAGGATQLRVIYHDYSGLAHGKTVPPERFSDAAIRGIGFAKANMDFNLLDLQVPHPVFGADTGDFFAVPDRDTYALLPHRSGVARTYSFLHLGGGERWEGCPRTALDRVVDQYARRNLHVQVAFEPECFLLTQMPSGGYEPADRTRMFELKGLDLHHALVTRLLETLSGMGLVLEQAGAEYGPGQFEVNIKYSAALRAADNLLTLRETFKALAADAGLTVSFMPKPFTHLPGCGLHVHLGFTDKDGHNLMDGDGLTGLSRLGGSFVAGLLAHSHGLCGVGAPTMNSYKRLLPGSWAPAHVCYGTGNRAVLVRIPESGSIHVEFRAGDNTSNPYLFLAALLAAGMDGIQNNMNPGEPANEDVGHLSEETLREQGIRFLPRTAREALDAVEADETIMAALGPVIGPTFLRVKRSELATYELEVSNWERDVFLEST